MQKVTKHGIILYDPEDHEVMKNTGVRVKKDGYKYVRITTGPNNGKMASRILMNCTDPKMHVDHKDRDTLNNRKENLRIITPMHNNRNKNLQKNQIWYGVHYHNNDGNYRTQLNRKCKVFHDKHSAIKYAYQYILDNWETFPDTRSLEEVLNDNEQHYIEPIQCKLCKKESKDKALLLLHKKNYHVYENITCNCGKFFEFKGPYRDHKRYCKI